MKGRSNTQWHHIFDSVRGTNIALNPNVSNAESAQTYMLTSPYINSDGFRLGTDAGANASGVTYVAWCWKANGSGSSNTDGSINTTATSANTTSKFSISTYTATGSSGATIGHGLGVVPAVIIVKIRSGGTYDWAVYHHKNTSAPETDWLQLNETDATADVDYTWDDTAPTSSVVQLGGGNPVNGDSGWTYVAYCWSEVQGFSKFGSYIGNGNADGAFVYTGFRPAWLLIKRSSASGVDWILHDNKRAGFNVNDDYLAANTTATEVTGNTYQNIDLLSNGFKMRGSGTGTNTSGETYVYMAFAEAPFVNSKGVPCNAR
jgi:hypothetical protein